MLVFSVHRQLILQGTLIHIVLYTTTTCSEACDINQPPLWDPGQHEEDAVLFAQLTDLRENIGQFPGMEPQLLKPPLDLPLFVTQPPEGRVGPSSTSLKKDTHTPWITIIRYLKSDTVTVLNSLYIYIYI